MNKEDWERFLYEQFEKDDIKHPFVSFVSGVLLGVQIASFFFLNQKDKTE